MCAFLALLFSLNEVGPKRATAGYVVVMADITPLFPLQDDVYEAFEGNRRLFRNITGEPGSVIITGGSPLHPVSKFYATEGVSSKWTSGELTQDLLKHATLVVSENRVAFTTAEAQLLRSFVGNGGNLFLGVEPFSSLDANPLISERVRTAANTLLKNMSIDVVISRSGFDPGTNIARGSKIAVHPLTQDVSALNYGWASQVIGGEPLFFSRAGLPFTAAVFIPEPSSITLATAAALSILSLLHRRK
jgi:hypothetical protein